MRMRCLLVGAIQKMDTSDIDKANATIAAKRRAVAEEALRNDLFATETSPSVLRQR